MYTVKGMYTHYPIVLDFGVYGLVIHHESWILLFKLYDELIRALVDSEMKRK